MVKIIDNFLTEVEFNKVEGIINDKDIPWCLSENLNRNSKTGDFQFTHLFPIEDDKDPQYMYVVKVLLSKLVEPGTTKRAVIQRARVNLFIRMDKEQRRLGFHRDIEDAEVGQTILHYLEDSNGYTEFKDGQISESVKNRAVIFDSNLEHSTVTQTDVLFRKNININFKFMD